MNRGFGPFEDIIMKLLFLGDLHTGVKKDDPWMEGVIKTAIQDAVTYSKANGITNWIQTGDWFDVRKAITHRTMEFVRTEIIPLLEEAGIKCYVTVGNHDMMLLNKIQPNAPRELLAEYSCIHVVDKPETHYFDSLAIDMIPWMCEDNTSEILDFIHSSASAYCVGHFELNGYFFYKNIKSTGYEPDFLKTYKKVISGHFHTQSEGGNVQYIGTPYTITSGDENEQRGFFVLDTETYDFDFIPNKKIHHVRLSYPGDINPELYEGCSVRLVASAVDAGLTKLETELTKHVHELRTINKAVISTGEDIQEDATVVETKSILGMIESAIRQNPSMSEEDMNATIRLANELYTTAMAAK